MPAEGKPTEQAERPNAKTVDKPAEQPDAPAEAKPAEQAERPTAKSSEKPAKQPDAPVPAAPARQPSGQQPAEGGESSDQASGQADADKRVIAGRYRIERRLGGGAMGVVYLANDTVLGRTVAVKELLLPHSLSEAEAEQARKRSFREARLAARLQHRDAITVFNVVEDDGKPVLVMEYLPSRSLAEVLAERGRVPPEEASRIGAHVASALAAAHAAGIVHRDVKPGNILIGDGGGAKITDFGISRAADDGTITGSGRFAGTPAYLSPEAARGESPGQASDVFSLGATLYTAVEGRFPYGDLDNQMALLYAAAAGRYTPPTQAGPLTETLSRMMRLDPAERPTMAEVALELGQVSGPVPAGRKGRRALVLAGLAVVVVVAAGVAGAILLSSNHGGAVAAPPPATSSLPAPPLATPAGTQPPSPATAAPSASASHSSGTTDSTPATHSTTPATVTTAAPASSMTQAVSEYYSIIPGNLDLGWTKLGPVLQQQGKANYESYWLRISNLTVVSGPTQVGPDTVEVTIEYTKDGTRYRETHRLGMIEQNGQFLINTDPPVGYEIVG
ncbi:MAG TPA: protein kinase [Amycolatopsis sp.]|nr:protein kinase [Amycolatopsis sp.]